MQYVEAAKFFFKDKNWLQNAMIGTVFLIIPILGPIALAGWHCEIAQRLHRKDEELIPKLKFNDLMTYFQRGIPAFVAQLVAAIPTVLVVFILNLALIPVVILFAGNLEMLIVFSVAIGLVSFVVAIGSIVVVNAFQTRAELTEDFAEALNFRAALRYMKATFGTTLISYFVFMLVCTPLMFLGMLLCFIGIYPVAVGVNAGAVHLRMQIYTKYLQDGGEPIPVRDPEAPFKKMF